jgi:hypothetical protein
VTVATKLSKVRDLEAEAKARAAEAQAEIDRMQYEAWQRMQEQNKPKQDQPLTEDAQKTLTIVQQEAAPIANPCFWGEWTLAAGALGGGVAVAANGTYLVETATQAVADKGAIYLRYLLLRGGGRNGTEAQCLGIAWRVCELRAAGHESVVSATMNGVQMLPSLSGELWQSFKEPS